MAVDVRALSELAVGELCRVESIDNGFDHAARMAGLGLSVGREIRVVRVGEPTVVQVYGSRIGIAREIARRIRVVPAAIAVRMTTDE